MTEIAIHVLSDKPTAAITKYLEQCRAIGADVDLVRDVALATIAKHGGKKVDSRIAEMVDLAEERWYASVAKGKPEWGMYNEDYYLGEVWACWAIYSRTYLRGVQVPKSLDNMGIAAHIGPVAKIVDLGCGIGYTTAALKGIWPEAEVIGTNLEGTPQTAIAGLMGQRFGFDIKPSIAGADGSQVDLVFASEYFEHFQTPIEHLREILGTVRPRAMLVANTFGGRAIGHFILYKHSGQIFPGRAMSRMFGQEMRRQGYQKIKTTMWNGRPTYWRLAKA